MVNLNDMKALALNNGLKKTGEPGKCLSERYVNDKTKLKWQCGKCGYKWETSPNSIKRGRWCAKCVGNIKYTIEDMEKFAIKRGIVETSKPGKCLSKDYINNKANLIWKCGKCKNTWKASPKNVIHNTWCPYCSSRKTERKVRKILETIFDAKLPCKSPVWLINPKTNHRMHFDGYNAKLKLAFEYNGIQHYFHTKYFHKTFQEFKDLQLRDKYKEQICKSKGITLILIPYSIKLEAVKDYVYSAYPDKIVKTL